MLTVRKAENRGRARSGWLDSRHTFSFANYFDPEEVGFSDLLVINDDRIQPGEGFSTHPHRDMEIFSYVLDGEIAHKDSMGTLSVSRRGDIQMMSAGSGIFHSEFNASKRDMLRILQIWIIPDRRGVPPRYHQKHFPDEEKRGKFRMIISPGEENGSLPIYQDARVYAGLFDGAEKAELVLPPGRYAFVHLARGQVTVNGTALREGDGARIREETVLKFEHGDKAEVLVFDLRAKEIPDIR